MECLLCELKFDMKALFYAYFHFDNRVLLGFHSNVLYDELFFLRDAVVIAIDDYIDEVAQANDDSIV